MNTEQRNEYARGVFRKPPIGFTLACAAAFGVGTAATIHFSRSMCCEMEMPGGRTMSMMWMRMGGQTWFASATSFLLMWLAMMIAMMMPSALPTFLRSRQAIAETEERKSTKTAILMTVGYFAMWLAAGAGVYVMGVAFAMLAMRWELFNRMVPTLSGALLIVAGATQFTRWKMSRLVRCRNPLACEPSANTYRSGWHCGLKQGFDCVICCSGLMLALLLLGAMNLAVMAAVTAVITAERFVSQPQWIARASGAIAIITGALMMARLF